MCTHINTTMHTQLTLQHTPYTCTNNSNILKQYNINKQKSKKMITTSQFKKFIYEIPNKKLQLKNSFIINDLIC